MPSRTERSSLKRSLGSNDSPDSAKKPRRSQRISATNPFDNGLPSPVTVDRPSSHHADADNADPHKRASPSPSHSNHADREKRSEKTPPSQLRSPPGDTQPLSQFLTPIPYNYKVKDEEEEGVWGYLIPIDNSSEQQGSLVFKRRSACPLPEDRVSKADGKHKVEKDQLRKEEDEYEEKKLKSVPAGGYLIGRHPECDYIVSSPTVSNRHCLVFVENKLGSSVAVIEDLSGNGTYVNNAYVGRNKRRELNDGDEIAVLDIARFIFRYPRVHDANGFRQQFTMDAALGKGHFATVYMCTEKNTGMQYAVKHFERRSRGTNSVVDEKSKVDGLQQEVAVLMGVSHPNVLCLKDTFNEEDGVYLILELAAEGELFNCIVRKHKLTEVETRKIFVQLFKGVKYLHERNIVHRDIKPENILLIDKELNIKIADFGLAKIIGEESFTTTLCGTPSYVAPEILESGNRRRYTKAVDVWSLGVVLYICLCGFPPFSDELYTKENPYNLADQIKTGRFDYPSPYWDSVGDAALDLIDRMLTVDVSKRISIDECLEHPWTTGRVLGEPGENGIVNPVTNVASADSLTGALHNLDFTSRKVKRERTLLSAINDVSISRIVNAPKKPRQKLVKIFAKNQKPMGDTKEPSPAHNRDAKEFIAMGGAAEEPLFEGDGTSNYLDQTMPHKLIG